MPVGFFHYFCTDPDLTQVCGWYLRHENESSGCATARQHKVVEAACYRIERTPMGCADPSSKGVGAPHQCSRVNKNEVDGGSLSRTFTLAIGVAVNKYHHAGAPCFLAAASNSRARHRMAASPTDRIAPAQWMEGDIPMMVYNITSSEYVHVSINSTRSLRPLGGPFSFLL